MIRIDEIKLPAINGEDELFSKVLKKLKAREDQVKNIKILRKSLDARKKDNPLYVYSIACDFLGDEAKKVKSLKEKHITLYRPVAYSLPQGEYKGNHRPIVVGAGPAGLFAALVLAEKGCNPLILEQGKRVQERQEDIENFFATGVLSTTSNIQFGQGGAGTFSDGKLTTGTKDVRHRRILEDFVKAGAPEEILYFAKPHIGSDILPKVVTSLCCRIEALGGEFAFETRWQDMLLEENRVVGVVVETSAGKKEIPCDHLVMALGHSARDTYEILYEKGVLMTPKAFSLGVRIEHPQHMINQVQYGTDELGAADYKLAVHLEDGRSVYTFCMCPGGVVVGAASEEGGVVTNGMSTFHRDKKNANSALLVGVTPKDFPSSHPLAGMYWQRDIEKAVYHRGGCDYTAPCQRVEDFLNQVATTSYGSVLPTYKPKTVPGDISKVLPAVIVQSLRQGLPLLAKKLKGFDFPDALLTAAETRSSAPLRMVRSEIGESNIKGLYPAGEGSGYAGGIMSAAADGIKIAEFIVNGEKSLVKKEK